MSRYTVQEIQADPSLLFALSAVEQTEALCIAAIQADPRALEHVRQQTALLCELAIRADPSLLRFVKNQTHELCALAVNLSASSFRYVRRHTHELALLAVRKNGIYLSVLAIAHTPEICLAAVQSNSEALEHVELPYDRITSPQSGQLRHWIDILQACRSADAYALYKTLIPLTESIPLGKRYHDEWLQPIEDATSKGVMLDQLMVLAAELRRLAGSHDKIDQFCHRVNQQVERTLRAPQRAERCIASTTDFGPETL